MRSLSLSSGLPQLSHPSPTHQFPPATHLPLYSHRFNTPAGHHLVATSCCHCTPTNITQQSATHASSRHQPECILHQPLSHTSHHPVASCYYPPSPRGILHLSRTTLRATIIVTHQQSASQSPPATLSSVLAPTTVPYTSHSVATSAIILQPSHSCLSCHYHLSSIIQVPRYILHLPLYSHHCNTPASTQLPASPALGDGWCVTAVRWGDSCIGPRTVAVAVENGLMHLAAHWLSGGV